MQNWTNTTRTDGFLDSPADLKTYLNKECQKINGENPFNLENGHFHANTPNPPNPPNPKKPFHPSGPSGPSMAQFKI
jgi:hypothetical protein